VNNTTYNVELENFNGPLDLLLSLIEKQKLDICDISLANVTGDYLTSIQDIAIDPHQANWFLDIATRLILYKSRALLPAEQIEQEPIDDLSSQLQILASIKESANNIKELSSTPMYFRKKVVSNNKKNIYTNLNLNTILHSYPKKINNFSKNSSFKLKILLRAKLQAKWQELKQLELSQLDQLCDNKYETVVLFLLSLEMIKDKKAVIKNVENKVLVEMI
jgi:segregation and condensation protein A